MNYINQSHTWTPATVLVAALLSLASCGASSDSSGGPVIPPDPQPDPLTIETPTVQPGISSAVLTWSTSLPTTACVNYGPGLTTGSTEDIAIALTDHTISLLGLQADAPYRVQVVATGLDGREVVSDFVDFRTSAVEGFRSDDFFANNLDTDVWTFENPLGGAGIRMLAGSTGEGALELSVPAGVNSSPWLVLDGARVTQQVVDEDITLQAIFTGAMGNAATGQGLVFEEDRENWARFDFAYNGGKLQLFAGVFANGSLQNMVFSDLQTGPWPAGSPLGMRVTRTGNQYAQEYSMDGLTWLAGPTMTSNLTLAKAGVFIAAEGNPSLGMTSIIDSIESSASPILNEDGQMAPDTLAPHIFLLEGTALGADTIELNWATDEMASAEVRYGQTTAYSDGIVTLSSLDFSKAQTIGGLMADTPYFLQVRALDALGQASTKDIQISTPVDNTIGSPTISVWGANVDPSGTPVMRFGDLGFAQPQINILGNVQDPDEDRVAQTVDLAYRVGQGSWIPLAMGDDRTINYAPWRLANEGDFNAELFLVDLRMGLPVGGVFQHDVMLRATDDENHVTYQELRVEIVDGTSWAPNYTINWADVLNQGGDPTTVGQIIDGKWNVENVAGLGPVLRADTNELGYDRLVGIGQGEGAGAWDNYEAEMDLTILGLDPQGYTQGTSSYAFGFVMGWTGHTDGGQYSQPRHGLYPLGGSFLYRWFDNNERWQLWTGHDEGIQNLPGGNVSIGTRYSIKLRSESLVGGGNRYAMKMWPFGTTEPNAWTFDETTPVTDNIDKGSLVLVAHHADVAFGNIQVTQLP